MKTRDREIMTEITIERRRDREHRREIQRKEGTDGKMMA